MNDFFGIPQGKYTKSPDSAYENAARLYLAAQLNQFENRLRVELRLQFNKVPDDVYQNLDVIHDIQRELTRKARQ